MNPFQDIDQRQYSVMDLLEKTTRGLFGTRFWEFFAPVLIFTVAMSLWTFYLMQPMLEDMVRMMEYQSTGSGDLTPMGMADFWKAWLGVMVVGFLGFSIGAQYVLLRMKHAVFAEAMPWQDTLRESLDPQRLASFLVTGLAAGLGIWAGCLLCLLPGLALLVVFTLLPACLTFHPQRFSFPLMEPFGLLQGRFAVTVTALAIPKLIYLVVSWLLSFLFFMNLDLDFLSQASTENPDVLMQEYLALFQHPAMLWFQVASGILTGLLVLVLGFLTVVMYFNYTMTDDDSIIAPPDLDNIPEE